MSVEQSVEDVEDVADATPKRRPRVTFVSGTSHSRASVGLGGVQREVSELEGEDGEAPPPAGCPCSSGF